MTKTKVVHPPHRLAKTGRCLFGYSADTDLGILHVGPAGTFVTGDCNTVDDTHFHRDQKTRISVRNGE